MIEDSDKIEKYVKSLIYHNVYDDYDNALEESKWFWNKADEGLVEPMKCLPSGWVDDDSKTNIIHYYKKNE